MNWETAGYAPVSEYTSTLFAITIYYVLYYNSIR